MAKNWKILPPIPEDAAKSLAAYPPLVRQLLYNRELADPAEAEVFLHPEYEKLLDPFLFRDMEKAVSRIWQAILQKEKICIYGDYDADAVTANAVLQQTFRHLGVEVESYIPDRFSEGYGVNLEAMAKIRERGVTVIITVDCGTNSVDAAEFCKENGIDFIITDHHEIIGDLPQAYALINPKNPHDRFPYHDITGVGVAFKLACAILKNPKTDTAIQRVALSNDGGEIRNPKAGFEKWLLDLVAIGTVADCHELMGENRILVSFGLLVLAKTRWTGLRALLRAAGLDGGEKKPDTYTLGFVVAPRLNAAGRLEHASIALNLLLEEDAVAAQERALALEQINQRRQQLTERALSEAREQALVLKDRKLFVLVGEGWPKGVVGLVAGRIAEEFFRPTIALSSEAGEATGSARTVGDFDIVESLKYASEFLTKFGRHKQAAGLSLKSADVEPFYQKLLEYAEIHLAGEQQRTLELEAELSPGDLELSTVGLVAGFEPFGAGNPRPKFLVRNLKIQNLRAVGSAQNHLQLQVSILASSGTRSLACIAFNAAHFAKTLKVGDTVDVACELMEDGWNGRQQLKLRIVDIKASVD